MIHYFTKLGSQCSFKTFSKSYFVVGKWNDAHCATKYGYVCKAMVGSTPTPIAPTSPWIGFCPVGYSLLHNKCYRVFNQAVNWTTARTICQQEGSGYDLASVQSDEENGKSKSLETCIS